MRLSFGCAHHWGALILWIGVCSSGCAQYQTRTPPPAAPVTLAEFPPVIELPYSEKYLDVPPDSPHAGRYSDVINKKDVVLVGENVSIDKAISTNGGDVLVIADNVELCASIDTRVHIDHSSSDAQVDSGTCKGPSNYFAIAWPGQPLPKAGVRHSSYYEMARPRWDEGLKRWVAEVNDLSAELPSGITACATPVHNSPAIPFPIASIDRAKIKSGNILIVAHKVSICKQLAVPNLPAMPNRQVDFPECSAAAVGPYPKFTLPDPTLLLADGVHGGRPGLPLRGCHEFNDPNNLCGSLVPLNTQPGEAGGDAGDVRFVLVGAGAAAKNEHQLLLKQRASALGGGNYGKQMFEPCPPYTLTGNHKCNASAAFRRCSFAKGGADYPEASGNSGMIEVVERDTIGALNWAAAELMAIEGKANHDYAGQLKTLAPFGYIGTGTTKDILTAYLEISLSRANQLLSAEALDTFTGQPNPPSPFLPTLLNNGFADPADFPIFSLDQRILILRLGELETLSGYDPLKSFAVRSGGILWTTVASPGDELQKINILQAVTQLDEAVRKLTEATVDLHIDVHNWITEEEKRKFELLIGEIATRLEAAKEAAKKDSKFANIIDELEGIVELGKQAYQSYLSGQYHKMAKPIYGIYQSLRDIEDIWNSDNSNTIADLTALLARSKDALESYVRAVEARKLMLLDRKGAAVTSALAASAKYYDMARQARQLHGDFQRLNIATLLADRELGGSDLKFVQNQNKLMEFAGSYPAKTVVFANIKAFPQACKAGEPIQNIDDIIGKPVAANCVRGHLKPVPSGWFVAAAASDPLLSPFDGFPLHRFKAGGPNMPYALHNLIDGDQLVEKEVDLQAGP